MDLAVQAVGGTKGHANVANTRSLNAGQLNALLERTERAVTELKAQNEAGDEPDARAFKVRRGSITGYNAQAMVSPLAGEEAKGMIVTAVESSTASTMRSARRRGWSGQRRRRGCGRH